MTMLTVTTTETAPKPNHIASTMKVLGISWILFSIIAASVAGSKIAQKFETPPVEVLPLDYGPYKPTGDKELVETTKHVALFRIDGVISGTGEENSAWVRQMCREIEKAGENPDVKGLLLEINSPGGEVAAADSIHKAVARTAKQKPVVAYFGSLAASGGYYIGCAAKTIITHPESLTGSIGVIIQSTNYSEAFHKLGLENHTFKSGQLKDMLNGARPLEEMEKTYIQELVNKTYESFLNIVATSRNLNAEELRKEAADGRIIKGSDAVTYKLADQTGEFRDAISEIRKQADAENSNIVLYRINTHKKGGLLSLLGKSPEDMKLQITTGTSFQTSAGTPWTLPSGVPLLLYN